MALPDLSRTKAAIEAYDAFDAQFNTDGMDNDQVLAAFAELERMGEAVGIAFGLDTADRNSLETCRGCIRPDPKVPGPGQQLSFVRRAVARWEAESAGRTKEEQL